MNKYYDLFIIIVVVVVVVIGTVERKEADSNQTCKPVAPLATHFAIKSAQACISFPICMGNSDHPVP